MLSLVRSIHSSLSIVLTLVIINAIKANTKGVRLRERERERESICETNKRERERNIGVCVCQRQCDQMARLFFQIWPFTTPKICQEA